MISLPLRFRRPWFQLKVENVIIRLLYSVVHQLLNVIHELSLGKNIIQKKEGKKKQYIKSTSSLYTIYARSLSCSLFHSSYSTTYFIISTFHQQVLITHILSCLSNNTITKDIFKLLFLLCSSFALIKNL